MTVRRPRIAQLQTTSVLVDICENEKMGCRYKEIGTFNFRGISGKAQYILLCQVGIDLKLPILAIKGCH